MLSLRPFDGWRPPVVATTATSGAGVGALWEAIRGHRAHLLETGELARRRSARAEAGLRRVLAATVMARVDDLARGPAWDGLRAEVEQGRVDPWSAAARLVGD